MEQLRCELQNGTQEKTMSGETSDPGSTVDDEIGAIGLLRSNRIDMVYIPALVIHASKVTIEVMSRVKY